MHLQEKPQCHCSRQMSLIPRAVFSTVNIFSLQMSVKSMQHHLFRRRTARASTFLALKQSVQDIYFTLLNTRGKRTPDRPNQAL